MATTAHRPVLTPVRQGARLAPGSSAPQVARRLVREACARSPLPERLVADAAFVAGELVTLSVAQTRSALDLLVLVDADAVTVRVLDAGRMSPDAGTGSTGRRCWALVNRVGAASGYRDTGRGREMWASLLAA